METVYTYGDILRGARLMQETYPSWRLGQAVFNYCDMTFGTTARTVQFVDGIDCFFAEKEKDVKPFIEAVLHRVNSLVP